MAKFQAHRLDGMMHYPRVKILRRKSKHHQHKLQHRRRCKLILRINKVMSQKKYFGTDGIRGKVGGSVINPEFIKKLGYAIGIVLNAETKTPRVLIGRATRESGESLQNALQDELLSAGVDVVLLGIISTPAVAFLTKKLSASAG